MASGSWLNAWIQCIEPSHDGMKTICILLDDFHRFQLFKSCFLTDFIFCIRIHIAFEMPYIGDISDIAHFIAQVHEISVDQIKADKRPAIADMDIIIYRGAADVHSYPPFQDGREYFFGTADAVIHFQTHGAKISY